MKTIVLASPGELLAAVHLDLLVPASYFYAVAGGRVKFIEYRRMGLPLYHWNGRRCVRPSELKRFMDDHAKPAPSREADDLNSPQQTKKEDGRRTKPQAPA